MARPKKLTFALFGGALLLAGILLLSREPHRAQTVIASASGCNLRLDIIEPVSGEPQGYIVLFHGLSANKRVMSYVAEGFANQDLRVFVPDFPGHGRTPGPFSFDRAESCAASMVNELIERRALAPQQTVLVGHSMGGSIAMRVAARISVAGVIAISPAPMHSGHGVRDEMLPYRVLLAPPPHTLAVRGAWEPKNIRSLDRAYLTPMLDHSSRYLVISAATHVSLLFDSDLIRASRDWISRLLFIPPEAKSPSHAPLLGALIGFAGLCVLVVPFLIETVAQPDTNIGAATALAENPVVSPNAGAQAASFFSLCASSLLRITAASVVATAFLQYFIPLRFLHVFEGEYLSSFFLVGGGVLLLSFHARGLREVSNLPWRAIFLGAFAAGALVALFGGWFELTFFEAFLTLPRWLRLPVVALAVLPWHLAEQLLLGPIGALSRTRRVVLGVSFRIVPWICMTVALLFLHSGEILIALLSAYFLIFFVLQRMAVDLVHRETRSATAAAVFGAILFAGLALAIFPVA